jgi:hypothetical protein
LNRKRKPPKERKAISYGLQSKKPHLDCFVEEKCATETSPMPSDVSMNEEEIHVAETLCSLADISIDNIKTNNTVIAGSLGQKKSATAPGTIDEKNYMLLDKAQLRRQFLANVKDPKKVMHYTGKFYLQMLCTMKCLHFTF